MLGGQANGMLWDGTRCHNQDESSFARSPSLVSSPRTSCWVTSSCSSCFPALCVPYIDKFHSVMLFWLRPRYVLLPAPHSTRANLSDSRQIRPPIYSIKQSKLRRRRVIRYRCPLLRPADSVHRAFHRPSHCPKVHHQSSKHSSEPSPTNGSEQQRYQDDIYRFIAVQPWWSGSHWRVRRSRNWRWQWWRCHYCSWQQSIRKQCIRWYWSSAVCSVVEGFDVFRSQICYINMPTRH